MVGVAHLQQQIRGGGIGFLGQLIQFGKEPLDQTPIIPSFVEGDGQANLGPKAGGIRIQGDGLFQGLFGFLESVQIPQGIARIAPQAAVVWPAFDRFLGAAQAFGGPPLLAQHRPQVSPAINQLSIHLQGLAIQVFRLGQIILLVGLAGPLEQGLA